MSDEQSLLEKSFIEGVGRDIDVDDTGERILAAASELVGEVGIQRATMDAVARRAGVSRITVYRRFATKEVLVEHAVRREFRRYFDQFLLDIAGSATTADRVATGLVSSLRNIRANPVIAALTAVDEPNMVMPSIVGDGGRTLAAVGGFLAGQLRREQQAGTVLADVDVEVVAELWVRLCTSFLIIPSHVIDIEDDDRLREVALRFFVPMLGLPG